MTYRQRAINYSGEALLNNSNSSDYHAQLFSPRWGIVPTFYLVILVCSVLGNGGLFSLMAIEKHLHTPFNIYVMNLLFCNALANILIQPFNLITAVYGRFMAGEVGCSIIFYARIVWATSFVTHSFITINRLWAVWFPLSYRLEFSLSSYIVSEVIPQLSQSDHHSYL